MAYEDDDVKPVRPASKARDAHATLPMHEQAKRPVLDREVTVTQTRAGDDDPQPTRPPEDVLRARDERIALSRAQSSNVEDGPRLGDDSAKSCDVESAEVGLRRLCVVVCLVLVAIWLLGIFGSTIHSISVAQTLLEKVVFLIVGVLELVVVGFVVCFARRTFARLPKIVQLRRSEFAGKRPQLAERLRCDYLRGFPPGSQYAEMAGFREDDPALFMLARLKDHRYADSVGFMEEYEKFQGALDVRALEIIKKYATLIGLKTAASPWKAVDMIAVFFNSTLMVCDLAIVYQRRTTRRDAFRLVVRWFVNLYISGELGEVVEGGADAISDGASEWLKGEDLPSLLQPTVPLLAKFGGKIVEGGANAYLAYRLGRRASQYFKELID